MSVPIPANCSGLAYRGVPAKVPRVEISYQSPIGRFVADELRLDNLQRYSTSKIDVARFISDSHRAAAQLKRRSIIVHKNLIVVQTKLGNGKSWLADRILDWRLIAKSSAQSAHRTGFAAVGEQRGANRTDPYFSGGHGFSASSYTSGRCLRILELQKLDWPQWTIVNLP